MRYFKQMLSGLLLTIIALPVIAEDKDISDIFEQYNAKGTLVIASLDGESIYIHNVERANQRLSPVSTFKIPNTIIALEEKVIEDEHEIIPWDGQKRWLAAWNADQTLISAFKVSCVWCYQDLAKKIGREKYLDYLKLMNYGNQKIGSDVTRFWLDDNDSNLQISVLEKITFLKKLYLKKFSFSERNYDILKNIMLENSNEHYKLYSKTGASADKDWVGHGWYAGYMTVNNQVWFFATNILLNSREDLAKRKQITLAVLKAKDVV